MGVNKKAFEQFQKKVEALRDDMPAIMEQLVIGEGKFAVDRAKQICKNDAPDAINTGHYQRNFHAGDQAIAHTGPAAHDGSKPKKSGTWYKIDVYNNLDYAKPLEYGFRSHFVPGKYLSGPYRKKFPNGMYVGKPGSFVRGKFVLQRAVKDTKATQDARLQIKLDKIIADRLK